MLEIQDCATKLSLLGPPSSELIIPGYSIISVVRNEPGSDNSSDRATHNHSFLKMFYKPLVEKLVILDIFVKKDDDKYTYWQSMGKFLRVDKSHYESHETLDFMGYKLTAPYNYKDYLTAKYGDWSEPVKEWHCKDDEKTIVG